MKIAIVGIGKWGKNLLKEFNDQAEVVWAVHADSEESVKFLKTDYPHIKGTANLEDVLNDPEIEAIVVATPTDSHFDIASRVLDKNKHLFLEKPGTHSSETLQKLVKITEERNLKFAIGYEFPHSPAFKKLKESVGEQKISSIHFEWQKWGTFRDDATLHLLCHEISIIEALGIKSLSPANHHRTKVLSSTDIIRTEFENEENIYIESIINRISPIKQKTVMVILETGGYVWSNNDLFYINREIEALEKIELSEESPVSAEIADFLDSIKEDREPFTNGRFALDVYKVLKKIS